jgi:hypothetical protein
MSCEIRGEAACVKAVRQRVLQSEMPRSDSLSPWGGRYDIVVIYVRIDNT